MSDIPNFKYQPTTYDVNESLYPKYKKQKMTTQQTFSAPVEQLKSSFYGVYLLCSQSPEKRYNGKCYIGFTVNPMRRIKQHNRGKDFGGAKKTSNKGPWKMIMIIHGFPNNIAALQFEWAWQQPSLSSRLKGFPELKRKLPKETYFQYNFRILSRMLNVGPWERLPLTVRWLESNYETYFDPLYTPPKHMEIVNGSIALAKPRKNKQQSTLPRAIWAPECHLCMQAIENVEQSRIGCLNNLCKLTCHVICLANHMISSDPSQKGHYIPISGECPLCETTLLWIELLQRKRKMQGIATEEDDDDEELEDDFNESEDEEINNIECDISFTQDQEDNEDSLPKMSLEVYELSD